MPAQDPIIDILIVDDSKLVHALAKPLLRDPSYKTFYFAYSASEALRVVRAKTVRFMITDWVMPRMNGIELLRIIREDPLHFSLPVLMLSAASSVAEVMYAMGEGADGYVVKPFTGMKLKGAIEAIARNRLNQTPLQKRMTEMNRLRLQKKYAEALKIGSALSKNEMTPEVLLCMGECLYKMNKHNEAVNLLQASLPMEECGKSRSLLGRIHLEKEEYGEAIEQFKQAAELAPLNLNKKVDLAEAYLKAEYTSEAEEVIDDIMKSHPTDMILTDIGKLYLENGDIEKASYYLEKDIQPTPETVHIFNNYGISLRRSGRFEESENVYMRCLKTMGDSYVIHFNLGMLYTQMKDHSRAEKAFEKAVELNPSHALSKTLLDSIRSAMTIKV